MTQQQLDKAITNALKAAAPAFGLPDFCAECERATGRSRFGLIFEAADVAYKPGRGLIGLYTCERGHTWTCWWSARCWLERRTPAA